MTTSQTLPQHCLNGQRSSGSVQESFSSAHLIGVCGSGMQALAELLCELGWRVSGSDGGGSSSVLKKMRQRGLRVHPGHQAQFLPRDTAVIVYSPAIGPENPERQLAAELGIPQMSYSEMLGHLMQQRTGIAVAGTHGKSSTSAMTACLLAEAGLLPSAVIGAPVLGRGCSGWAGDGELFVVESCEYRGSFLNLRPKYAAILGIEDDHFDCYRSGEELQEAFAAFAARVASDGMLLVRGDCPRAVAAAEATSAEVLTFSLNATSDWWASDLRPGRWGTRFRIFHRGQYVTEVFLPLPGKHNVLNALAAAALSHTAGASAGAVREGLAEFQGIARRFEYVGTWRGTTLIDDYAHHPTAVQATLATARREFGARRIWALFQPHQISRTVALLQQFADSFAQADEVLVAPVYAAREMSVPEAANSADDCHAVAERLAAGINHAGSPARCCASLDQIVRTLEDETRPGDVVITIGAGDIDWVHHELTRRLRRHHPSRRAVGALCVDESGWAG